MSGTKNLTTSLLTLSKVALHRGQDGFYRGVLRGLRPKYPCSGSGLTYPFRNATKRRSSSAAVFAANDLASMIQQKNTENSVIVYTRSWCPFCADVRQLLSSYNITVKYVELDNIVEGDDIQDTLAGLTGSRTVPQVFIGGRFIGGFDDTYSLHQKGELKGVLKTAGVDLSE